VALAARSRSGLEAVATGLSNDPPVLVADPARPEAPKELSTRALAVLGGVDVLVSNAGVGHRGLAVALDAELIDRFHAVNVRAPLLLIAALVQG
jgi:3-oxoacyl-[acyl-carrier protein] reductase